MRIIAGKHRSRNLNTLEGMNTRPMMDRMKESVFNTIGPYFEGGMVLDLFGGSGALSLESISRGASFAHINDMSRDAIKVITLNVKSLKEEEHVAISNLDYKLALKRFKDLKFDIVFLDPPYRLNIVSSIIDVLLEENMLNNNAFVVCQYVKGNVEIITKLRLIKNYCYGNSEVAIYQKND